MHVPDKNDLMIQPIEQAETMPSAWYVEPRFHDLDVEMILKKHWQYVGHVSQLAKPGDYLIADVLSNPIIVIRNQNHELNAFYNVCRHRGGPLATENGCAKTLSCQYHAWTYNLDGNLISTPRFQGVANFDKTNYGLTPVRWDVYDGLIFVNLSDSPVTLNEHLAGVMEQVAPIRMETMRFVQRDVYEAECNWKTYVDNYLEGYHVKPVHPELAKVLDTSTYLTEYTENKIIQHSEIGTSENPYHVPEGTAHYYYVFPNLMLNLLPTRLQLNVVIPLDVNRTRILFDYFYVETDPEKLESTFTDDRNMSDLIQRQDVMICEHVQKGLASQGYDKGRFSVQEEQGVYAFQCMMKQAYSEELST